MAGALGIQTNAVLTIVDDDLPGSLAFSAANYITDENGTNAIVTIVRSGGSAGAVSINVAVADGTATNGLDYVGMTNSLPLPRENQARH